MVNRRPTLEELLAAELDQDQAAVEMRKKVQPPFFNMVYMMGRVHTEPRFWNKGDQLDLKSERLYFRMWIRSSHDRKNTSSIGVRLRGRLARSAVEWLEKGDQVWIEGELTLERFPNSKTHEPVVVTVVRASKLFRIPTYEPINRRLRRGMVAVPREELRALRRQVAREGRTKWDVHPELLERILSEFKGGFEFTEEQEKKLRKDRNRAARRRRP